MLKSVRNNSFTRIHPLVAPLFFSFLPLLATLALPSALLSLALVGDLPDHVLLQYPLDLGGGVILPSLQLRPRLLLQRRQRFRVFSRLLFLGKLSGLL